MKYPTILTKRSLPWIDHPPWKKPLALMNQPPLKVVKLFRKERCEAPLKDPTLIPMKRSLPRMNHPPFKELKQLRNEM